MVSCVIVYIHMMCDSYKGDLTLCIAQYYCYVFRDPSGGKPQYCHETISFCIEKHFQNCPVVWLII